MKSLTYFLGLNLLLIFHSNLFGQSFVNGSFETTSASLSCNYNLVNGTFNSLMSNTNAFGAGNELDILINGCYNSGIPDGVRAVGVAANYDEFSLQLSGPLTIGTSYTIAFWSYGEVSFRPLGNIEIGASTSNSAFGTSIGIVSPVASTWTSHSITFTPIANVSYITVRNQMDGTTHWNHVDNFVFINPLAVELVSFEAKKYNDRIVELEWITNFEENSDYFIVEKSEDGINWKELNQFNAAGESSVKTNYLEYDYEPFSGTSYYRLTEVDTDGSLELYGIRSVKFDSSLDDRLIVFPNPASQSIKVNLVCDDLNEITIKDLLGRDVTNKVVINNLGSSVECEIQNLNSGVYYLKFKGEIVDFVKN